MPSLNKRCSCGSIIPIQKRSCDVCNKERNKIYDKTNRNQESKKFYGSKEWQRVRYIILSKNPFCIECERPADVVDHITPITKGGDKLNLDNLQPMCHKCHAIKTQNDRSK